jgi:subtilase family serine protease
MNKIIRYIGVVVLLISLVSLSIPVSAEEVPAQPDLETTQIQVTALYAGINNMVTVVIANNSETAVDGFSVKLEVNEEEIETINGNSILAKNDPWYWPLSVSFNWTPEETGEYALRAIVDHDGLIEESNEDNNEIENNVTVIVLEPVTVSVRVEGMTSTIWSGTVTFDKFDHYG